MVGVAASLCVHAAVVGWLPPKTHHALSSSPMLTFTIRSARADTEEPTLAAARSSRASQVGARSDSASPEATSRNPASSSAERSPHPRSSRIARRHPTHRRAARAGSIEASDGESSSDAIALLTTGPSELLSPGDVSSPQEVSSGQGASSHLSDSIPGATTEVHQEGTASGVPTGERLAFHASPSRSAGAADGGAAAESTESSVRNPLLLTALADPCAADFPSDAHVARGVVRVAVRVDRSGHAAATRILSESPRGEGFADAARRCAERLRFQPARSMAGAPVPAEARLELAFTARRAPSHSGAPSGG